MNNKIKGIFMVILASSIWGLADTFAQILMQNEKLDPAWLLTIRLLNSGILLLLISLAKKISIWEIWRDKKDAISIIILAVIGFLGVQYTYYATIQTGNAVTASLLHFLSPAFVMIYFSFRKRVLPTKQESMALILASIGTFLLITNGSIDKLTIPVQSVILGVLSAITAAFYLIYPVDLINKWGSFLVLGWGMIVSGIMMSFVAQPWNVPVLHTQSIILISYLVLFATLFGFLLYSGSLKYISSVETGLLSCVEPLVASISSYFLLGRTYGNFEVLGGVFIMGTICLITLIQNQRTVSLSKEELDLISTTKTPNSIDQENKMVNP